MNCPLQWQGSGDSLVFLGLIGLTMMEYGLSRKGFGNHLMFKNWVQFSVGIVAWWLIGYAFSFGNAGNHSNFIGEKYFGGEDWLLDRISNHGACASYFALIGFFVLFIINGAIMERAHYWVYPILAWWIMVWIWPVVVAWGWGWGWLMGEVGDENNLIDYGGAITIYIFAGTFALVGAIIIGKRVGRFDQEHVQSGFEMTQYPIYVIGALLTILGVWSINISQQGLGNAFGMAEVNTWICGGASSIVALKLLTLGHRDLRIHYISVFQGFIAGQVLISSSAFDTTPWQSGICGLMAGILFFLGVKCCDMFKIDDPMNITGTFFFPGIIGGFLPGFITDSYGVFWEGTEGHTLSTQVVGVCVIFGWSAFWAIITFGLLKVFKKHRLSDEIQKASLENCDIAQEGFVIGGGQRIEAEMVKAS
mmetsp:Transcript_7216/g.7070  ORF Transcript_7216/g.7070 Transcript_7216/m.7070 type:complete len:420 (-) Transcript_7216:28-1287(-)|eukprot:CAMPEP_0202945490 /NCGR_PEP_ID=MMETSP1395-20130829/6520_1 /ASSEMBLY_ACC=CAM_ASM_000871 /TAXON_ID=5961 /ORGANISM="Blepharisma japonicum, Strain Stock R1072" /LENGTH=419 /DNA_ID=CAMNT_0049645567 /DNA_START=178 /DNA_END=1437 /DNA_ORIENTATION=+